jgi:hypothetical protein
MEHKYKCGMGRVLSFIWLLFLVLLPAFGQDPELQLVPEYTGEGEFSPVVTLNQPLKDELDLKNLNRITLQQEGNMNQAYIRQLTEGDVNNLAKVYQEGEENLIKLYQKGQQNATDIQQVGYGNTYSGIHVGDNILNTVIQSGTGNMIFQELRASDLDFVIEQSGDGHELIQKETLDGIGYKVTQSGPEGMHIIIMQDNIYK